MATDWIKWCKGLHIKAEVLRIATDLDQHPQRIAGALMVFWEWADDNCKEIDEEGHGYVTLGALQPTFIDTLTSLPGFANSLSAVGWLRPRNGSLEFPNFGRHNGQVGKNKALTSKRVASHRERKSNAAIVTPVTVEALQGGTRSHIPKSPLSSKGKSFKKPSLEEIRSYCLERANSVDAQKFYDFYESKGWVVGKVEMKDWRASVRTWERNQFSQGSSHDDPRGNFAAGEQWLAMKRGDDERE